MAAPLSSQIDETTRRDVVQPTDGGVAVLTEPLEERLQAACRRIAPLWSLQNFVAVNPYLGLTDRRFEDAAAFLAGAAGARSTLSVEQYLDAVDRGRIGTDDLAAALADQDRVLTRDVAAFLDEVRASAGGSVDLARVATVYDVAASVTGRDWPHLCTDRVAAWAAAYFDAGQALWRSADPSASLFGAWKDEAGIDRTPEVMGLRRFRATVRSLPDDPVAAAEAALTELGVPADGLDPYLHRVLMRVGGWAAHAARITWEHQLRGEDDDTVVQFLAVLLCWEVGVLRGVPGGDLASRWVEAAGTLAEVGPQPEVDLPLARLLVLQDAYERAEQRRIVTTLGSAAASPAPTTDGPATEGRPRAQAVFCIDVRSEVFRRHLEAAAPDVRTIGFAGFFGFPVEYVPIAHATGEAQCPVLLTPGYTVAESLPGAGRTEAAAEARTLSHHVRRAWKSFKMGAISCFSFVGPVGLIYLPKMFSDSYGWTRPVRRPEDEALDDRDAADKGPTLAPVPGLADSGIAMGQRVDLAEGALRAMSLVDGFAPVVAILGHGASTVNNPYDTGLDCGACGGHTGEANARVATSILNDPEVRRELADRGIDIPADTWFVAGQHNTTTDEVTLFDRSAVPAPAADGVAALAQDLAAAGGSTRAERGRRMGITDPGIVDDAVTRRSTDWAQVRPEWGLAGCSAFVVAPRHRTQGLDLGGRSFLHSYDWRLDEGFGVLELIMTAPMVVASWISLQYYASTVENRLFGSGNKTLHNVVGRLGVLEGTAGDLRVGLPWQSVHDGESLQHEPVRLNVVIEAPRDAMDVVLRAHPEVKDLCDNGWIHLLAMDDGGAVSHRYAGDLQWEPLADGGARAA
jgi:uncharacterized protein YbcC (UPF0753/DUF2309 family)